jgi:hypothetical protein
MVIALKTDTTLDADEPSGFKTEYFADGSAIIVMEKGILLLESRVEYKVDVKSKAETT